MDNEKYFKIKKCDDWMKLNNFCSLVITNKRKGEGYIRYNKQLWRKLYKIDIEDEDNLKGFISHNKKDSRRIFTPFKKIITDDEYYNIFFSRRNIETGQIIDGKQYDILDNDNKNKYIYNNIRFDEWYDLDKSNKKLYQIENIYKYCFIEYNENKIYNDAIKNFYKKDIEYYNLKYNEYVVNNTSGDNKYLFLDTLNFTFTPIDDILSDKILTDKDSGGKFLHLTDNINTDIVDDILDSLISLDTKKKFKKLMYNLIVKYEGEEIIFNDYKKNHLGTWVTDILYTLRSNLEYIYSYEYYGNKRNIKKLFALQKIRCVIISKHNVSRSIECQINDFRSLGIKIFIIDNQYKNKNMYNEENFMKYLKDNKDKICEYVVDKKRYNIVHENDIFYCQDLLLTNFIKWCCVK
jgi:hypothetical protein